MDFKNRTVFITGGSRGIGKAIAHKLASLGANIAIAAKTTTPHPKLEGTIYSAQEELEALGAKVIAIPCDIRDEEQIANAIKVTAETFGGIDILINNASAISLTNTEATESKKYDLMMNINVRGTFLVTQHALPWLKKSQSAHILTLSPPLSFKEKWLASHIPYTISKYNMTMLSMGWSAEFKPYNIAVNTLWPRTTIATAAVQNLLGGDALIQCSRKPEILADTAAIILSKDSSYTGHNLIDDEVLQQEGITDLSGYAVNPSQKLYTDLFLD